MAPPKGAFGCDAPESCGCLDDINGLRYYHNMIRSFRNKETERLFNREVVRRFKAFESVARRKLDMVDAAHRLEDLSVPPGTAWSR